VDGRRSVANETKINWTKTAHNICICMHMRPPRPSADIYTHTHSWQRGSLVRTSVFGWQTFPDLWLICDHFVGKVFAVGQPTRPTQPSTPSVSVSEYYSM